jgi:hypothetical protein
MKTEDKAVATPPQEAVAIQPQEEVEEAISTPLLRRSKEMIRTMHLY